NLTNTTRVLYRYRATIRAERNGDQKHRPCRAFKRPRTLFCSTEIRPPAHTRTREKRALSLIYKLSCPTGLRGHGRGRWPRNVNRVGISPNSLSAPRSCRHGSVTFPRRLPRTTLSRRDSPRGHWVEESMQRDDAARVRWR
uniref:Uncharacterized protein n=1 Tax=Aegilops tauschii subsp. strangulata TaxID=200361 RepID=A0A453NCY3_AEGTS